MPKNQPTRAFNPIRTLQKFVVSTFVVCTFVTYAVHEHLFNPDAAANAVARTPSTLTQQLPNSPQAAPTASQLGSGGIQNAPAPTAPPVRATPQPARPAPQATPTSVARTGGLFKDGTYTGPAVNAFYGLVRVKAVIQNGKIADVQFLQYPNDRRTSQRINEQVMPWLQSEAIKAQSANVDFISGATLTSQAFARSLQAALNTAKN